MKKGISRASHRFHSQCVPSSHSLQSIAQLPIPREKSKERKMKKEKKKKSEGKEVKTKTARAALAGKGMCCWHCRSYRLIIERCTCRVEGGAAMQCTMEFSRAISP